MPREQAAAFRPIDRYQDERDARFRSLAFGLGNARLAAGATDGRVLLFDLSGSPRMLTVTADSFGVQSLALTEDGSTLLAAGRDGVTMIDARTGRSSIPTPSFPGERSCVASSPDGGLLATGGQDGSVYLRAASGEEVPTPPSHSSPIAALAFSPDGTRLLIGSYDETALWDVNRGEELLRMPFPTKSAAFTPDGEQVVVSNERGELLLLRADTLEEVRAFMRDGDSDGVWAVALSPDGELLASGSENGSLALWSVPDGEALGTLHGHQDAVLSLAFDPERQLLASAGRDGQVILWATQALDTPLLSNADTSAASMEMEEQLDDEDESLHMLVGHEEDITAVAVSPLGDSCTTADASGGCRLWSVISGEELAAFEAHEGAVLSLAFSPDGLQLASGGEDGTVRIWVPESGEKLLEGREHAGPVTALVWHPEEEGTLYSGGRDRAVRIWSLERGGAMGGIKGAFGPVTALAVSPDGRLLAIADETDEGDEPAVKLWDVSRMKYLGALHGHAGRITSLAFSPDLTCVLSGSEDGTARLWSMEKQDCVRTYNVDESGVLAVGVSPNSQVLELAGANTLLLYDAVEDEALYETQEHAGDHAAFLHSPSDELVIVSAIGAVARLEALPLGDSEDEEEQPEGDEG